MEGQNAAFLAVTPEAPSNPPKSEVVLWQAVTISLRPSDPVWNSLLVRLEPRGKSGLTARTARSGWFGEAKTPTEAWRLRLVAWPVSTPRPYPPVHPSGRLSSDSGTRPEPDRSGQRIGPGSPRRQPTGSLKPPVDMRAASIDRRKACARSPEGLALRGTPSEFRGRFAEATDRPPPAAGCLPSPNR